MTSPIFFPTSIIWAINILYDSFVGASGRKTLPAMAIPGQSLPAGGCHTAQHFGEHVRPKCSAQLLPGSARRGIRFYLHKECCTAEIWTKLLKVPRKITCHVRFHVMYACMCRERLGCLRGETAPLAVKQ